MAYLAFKLRRFAYVQGTSTGGDLVARIGRTLQTKLDLSITSSMLKVHEDTNIVYDEF